MLIHKEFENLKGDKEVETGSTMTPISECVVLYPLEGGKKDPVFYKKVDKKERAKQGVRVAINMSPNVWVLSPLKEIRWCHQTKQYEWSDNVRNVAISNTQKRVYLKDDFTQPRLKETLHVGKKRHKVLYAFNELVAARLGYSPSLSSNVWTKRSVGSKQTFTYMSFTDYNVADASPLVNLIRKAFEHSDIVVSPQARVLSKLLGNITFGVEFETAIGSLHQAALGRFGVIPLRDGSLTNSDNGQYEYATLPLKGSKGIQNLHDLTKRLDYQCTVDYNCALHLHLGNIPRTKLACVSIHALWTRLQEEIFEIMPSYKENEMILGKSKNYSSRNPSINFSKYKVFTEEGLNRESLNTAFQAVWRYYSADAPEEYTWDNAIKGSVREPWNRKWNCPTRYHALNFINYFFKRSGTMEFRVHEPTVKVENVLAWLFICVGIVRYATNYPSKVLSYKTKITLDDILTEISTNFGELKDFSISDQIYTVLNKYVQTRRDTFFNQKINSVNSQVFGEYGPNSTNFLREDTMNLLSMDKVYTENLIELKLDDNSTN